jgi:hypothetical protein
LQDASPKNSENHLLGFHAQTLEIFDILFDPRFGPNPLRFRPEPANATRRARANSAIQRVAFIVGS